MGENAANPATKAELLERIRTERAAWESLLSQIADAVMTQPVLADGWSVKDLIAHIAAYEQWTAGQVRAANEGRAPTNLELYGTETPSPALTGEDGWDLDRQNAAIHAQYRDTPLADVRAFAARAHQDLLDAITTTPDADLTTPGAQAWTGANILLASIAEQSYGHYGEHIALLRAVAGQDAV